MSEAKEMESKLERYIVIDIPPLYLPTPASVWTAVSPYAIIFVSFIAGIGLALCFNFTGFHKTVQPVPVIQQETLDAFVCREGEALSAAERGKLADICKRIIEENFEHGYEMREEFRFQRLKAGIDSAAFKTFSDKWRAKVESMHIEDTVTEMRRVYRALLDGLMSVKAYIDFSEDTKNASAAKPVDAIRHNLASIVTHEPAAVEENARKEEEPEIKTKPATVQRPRFFRRSR